MTDQTIDLTEELSDLVEEISITPTTSSVEEKSKTSRPDQWIRTRQCWCGECRFHSMRDRPKCPMHNPNDTTSHWLWGTNPEYIRRLSDEEVAAQMKEANISANIMPISPEDNR